MTVTSKLFLDLMQQNEPVCKYASALYRVKPQPTNQNKNKNATYFRQKDQQDMTTSLVDKTNTF